MPAALRPVHLLKQRHVGGRSPETCPSQPRELPCQALVRHQRNRLCWCSMAGTIQQWRIQTIAHERLAACLDIGTRHWNRCLTLQAALLSAQLGTQCVCYVNADVFQKWCWHKG